jgi:hypothetical protein
MIGRYEDLYSNPFLRTSTTLYRKIKLWVPFYYVKRHVLRSLEKADYEEKNLVNFIKIIKEY